MLVGLLTLFLLPDADRQANDVLSAIFQLKTFKESHFNRWRYISCYNGNISKKDEVLGHLISSVRVFPGTFLQIPQTWKTRYKSGFWIHNILVRWWNQSRVPTSSPKHKIWRWLFLKNLFIQFNQKITFKLPELQSRSIWIEILIFTEKKMKLLIGRGIAFPEIETNTFSKIYLIRTPFSIEKQFQDFVGWS